MAGINGEILIHEGLRPIWIYNFDFNEKSLEYEEIEPIKGLFHMFVTKKELDNRGKGTDIPYGLIEYEDGTMELVEYTRFEFADSSQLFSEYIWGEHKPYSKGGFH